MKRILLYLALPSAIESFVLSPASQITRLSSTKVASLASNDDVIAQLQAEYRQLQKQIYDNKGIDQGVDIDNLIEQAAKLTAFQRYKVQEIVGETTEEFKRAVGDLAQVKAESRRAHDEAKWASDQMALIESIDAGYEDMERLRDMAVAHASHDIELGLEAREVEALCHELEAYAKHEEALRLLKKLEEREAELKATLKELRSLNNKEKLEQWATNAVPDHEEFLAQIRQKLIDHDPTKGYEL